MDQTHRYHVTVQVTLSRSPIDDDAATSEVIGTTTTQALTDDLETAAHIGRAVLDALRNTPPSEPVAG